MSGPPEPRAANRLAFAKRAAFGLFALAAFMLFVGLGIWQIERRTWKLALIANVEARVSAPAGDAPGPPDWPSITAAQDGYRHVRVRGRFLPVAEALVQAATDYGGGFWVLVPFRTDRGFVVIINRGFVPSDRRDPASRAAAATDGETVITGLLRITEPKGAFLRTNDAAADRWYSRDIAAIAQARGLPEAAPYFIDADSTQNPGGLPIGGLTVIAFPNNHAIYAITWFLLAILAGGALVIGFRDRWSVRQTAAAQPRE